MRNIFLMKIKVYRKAYVLSFRYFIYTIDGMLLEHICSGRSFPRNRQVYESDLYPQSELTIIFYNTQKSLGNFVL